MGLGMPEVVLILVIALIVFGPRKLPELGKSLGQAMNQFRRASDEFKRTWEQEVEYEKVRKDGTVISSSSTNDTGYSADSDYQYGYETAATGYESTTSSDTKSATETTSATTDNKVESKAAVTEKKAEPQWI